MRPSTIANRTAGIFSAAIFAAFVSSASGANRLPEFGILYNDDSKLVVGSTVSAATQTIKDRVDNVAGAVSGTTFKTFIRNVAFGSDIMYYDTAIGSDMGWRTFTSTEIAATTNPTWTQQTLDYMADVRALLFPSSGPALDPIGVQAARAKEKGMFYLLGFRMNDHTGLSDNKLNPLIGEFRYNSYTASPPADDAPNLIDEVSSATMDRYYDFSKAAVRANRLALIEEFLDRYADTIDGLQLDFERTYTIIPPGSADAANAEDNTKTNKQLITEFVVAVRAKLDALAAAQERPMYLFVRVPSTVRDCEWCGIDITNWILDRRVDVVSPALFYDSSLSMPIEDFVVAAEQSGAAVYPSISNGGARYTGSRLFVEDPPSSDSTAETVEMRTAVMRGAAVNYRAQGAAGFEMFNFAIPVTTIGEAAFKVLCACSYSGAGRTKNKTFAVTAYRENLWRDTSGAEPLPLPVSWSTTAARTFNFDLVVHERFEPVGKLPQPIYVGLRLGLNGIQSTDQFTIKINGNLIYSGPAAPSTSPKLSWTTVSGTQSGVPAKQAYLQVEVPATVYADAAKFLRGVNDVEITVTSSSSAARSISEINLGVLYL